MGALEKKPRRKVERLEGIALGALDDINGGQGCSRSCPRRYSARTTSCGCSRRTVRSSTGCNRSYAARTTSCGCSRRAVAAPVAPVIRAATVPCDTPMAAYSGGRQLRGYDMPS